VYLHAAEEEENSAPFHPAYRPSSKTEEIPSPLYQLQPEIEHKTLEEKSSDINSHHVSWSAVYDQLKRDIFPILFLMMGSVCFLFGMVLLLFSQNGTLTLQWQEKDGFYFLLFAIPLVGFGWMFLQQLETED
jgi:hypothetical protein